MKSIQIKRVLLALSFPVVYILINPNLFGQSNSTADQKATGTGSGIASKPPPETNCFRLFDVNATGRNDVNAYLLCVLARLVYGDQLAHDINVPEKNLVDNENAFKSEFIKHTRNYFYNPASDDSIKTVPKFEFIHEGDSKGLDPEAMVIGTPNAVYVVFRGTDRVAGANRFTYKWGEWIKTDGEAKLIAPCTGCKGKVHEGFYKSLHYNNFDKKLIAKIKEFGGETKKVWLTGHSLGAGQAQMFAFFLAHDGSINAQGVYVYASPHPGDPAFAAELNRMFPKPRIQRFEFIDDLVTMVPLRKMGYGRAGIRNHFSKENPPSNYAYNIEERDENKLEITEKFYSRELNADANFCFHHQEWYAGSCFNNLSTEIKKEVPHPPRPVNANYTACTQFQVNKGQTGNKEIAKTIKENLEENMKQWREKGNEKIENIMKKK
jgi:hypothetical protein